MVIEAKFIGKDSLGYSTGNTYQLKLIDDPQIIIMRITGEGQCIYNSLPAFLRNWTSIKLIN